MGQKSQGGCGGLCEGWEESNVALTSDLKVGCGREGKAQLYGGDGTFCLDLEESEVPSDHKSPLAATKGLPWLELLKDLSENHCWCPLFFYINQLSVL